MAGYQTVRLFAFGDRTLDTHPFRAERGSVAPFLREVDGTRIRRRHSGSRRLLERRDSAFGDCRISGRRVGMVVAGPMAERPQDSFLF